MTIDFSRHGYVSKFMLKEKSNDIANVTLAEDVGFAVGYYSTVAGLSKYDVPVVLSRSGLGKLRAPEIS